MTRIEGVSSSTPVYKAVSPSTTAAHAAEPTRLPAADRLELSGISHILHAARNNDIRADKVADIRAQIEAGTYDDSAKLDSVLDRILDDVLPE